MKKDKFKKIGMTLDEIMAMKFPTKFTWGKWRFEDNLTLIHSDAEFYEVDLERMSSWEMLDWSMQLEGKNWITSEDLGDFVRALNDIFSVQHQLNRKQPREQYTIKTEYVERANNELRN